MKTLSPLNTFKSVPDAKTSFARKSKISDVTNAYLAKGSRLSVPSRGVSLEFSGFCRDQSASIHVCRVWPRRTVAAIGDRRGVAQILACPGWLGSGVCSSAVFDGHA